VPVRIDPSAGAATIGPATVRVWPAGPGGELRVGALRGPVVRPLAFGERTRTVVMAAALDDPVRAVAAAVLAAAATGPADEAWATAGPVASGEDGRVVEALAMALAGAGDDGPSFTDALLALVAAGWDPRVVAATEAAEVDRVAVRLGAGADEPAWQRLVFGATDADVGAVHRELAEDLIQRGMVVAGEPPLAVHDDSDDAWRWDVPAHLGSHADGFAGQSAGPTGHSPHDETAGQSAGPTGHSPHDETAGGPDRRSPGHREGADADGRSAGAAGAAVAASPEGPDGPADPPVRGRGLGAPARAARHGASMGPDGEPLHGDVVVPLRTARRHSAGEPRGAVPQAPPDRSPASPGGGRSWAGAADTPATRTNIAAAREAAEPPGWPAWLAWPAGPRSAPQAGGPAFELDVAEAIARVLEDQADLRGIPR
jgi:hypothetical protein